MKYFVLIFSIFTLSACSFKSLVFPNLDYLITSRIDQNLGLYGEQENEVKSDIQLLLRENISFVKNILDDIKKLNPKTFDSLGGYELLRSRYVTISEQVSAIMAKQIAKFDEKQIKQFYEINQEKNEEIEERIKDRKAEDYYGRYEFFLGDLNQKQKDLIKKNVKLFKTLSSQRLQNRLQTQNKMQDLFRLKDPEQKEKEIYALFLGASIMPITPERKQVIQLFGEIVSLMDKEQIKSFSKKRQEWVEWLEYYIKYFSSK